MASDTRVAIMQPTYFPWCGYFELIHHVDKFVFLDDVPFAMQRPNWQKENRVLSKSGIRWLKLPTIRTEGAQTLIKDMLVDNNKGWMGKHLDLIEEIYHESSYYPDFSPIISSFLNSGENNLSSINIGLIKIISNYLGIDTTFIRSSELSGISGLKQDRILSICHAVGGTYYYSPLGSADYIEPKGFERNSVKLEFQHYDHPDYKQFNNPGSFISHLSVLDIIFNSGKNAKNIII